MSPLSRDDLDALQRRLEGKPAEHKVGLPGCLFIVALVPVAGLTHAVVASVLWRWFVVPLGAPTIGVAHVYGLLCIVWLLRAPRTSNPSEPATWERLWPLVFTALSTPLVELGCGWLALQVMS